MITRSIGEAIDNLISVFSPQKALKLRNWRNTYFGYDAASPSRKDTPFPFDGHAETFNKIGRRTLRARARDLERNSDVVNGLIVAMQNNIIGDGINLQARSPSEDFNTRIESLFNEWKHSNNCDVTERQSLDEMARMLVARLLIDGGALLVYSIDNKKDIPLQVQFREVDDFADTSLMAVGGSDTIVSEGVEMTKLGKIKAYYLTQTDANGYIDYNPVRITADRVDFVWFMSRSTQYREVSPLGRSIIRIKDLDDYLNAVAFQQKTSACTSAYIESDNTTTAPGRPVNNADGNRYEQIRAGSVNYLNPGEHLKTLIPVGQAAEVSDYMVTQLRTFCASHGLSLESATRNVERVNYSSARQNLIADEKTFEVLRGFLFEHFLRPLYRRFVDTCYLAGLLNGTGFQFGNPEFYKIDWLASGLPWIDPLKEANADNVKLANGGISFQQYCANQGTDWKEQIDRMADVQAYAKAKGVTLAFATKDTSNTNDNNGEGNGKGEQL
jgi:lambda family phage portal protein